MAKEISDSELKSATGGYDSFMSNEACDALGLTLHKSFDVCESFAPGENAMKSGNYVRCCRSCLYCAVLIEMDKFVDPETLDDVACMIKK